MAGGESMASWSDGWWTSSDGLRLHYRDYGLAADPGRPPILCIPGLTRNARDFEGVAGRLAGAWRVIAVDLRGRGDSAWAGDPMSYNPLVYARDMEELIAGLGLSRFVLIGTSLGGLVAMLLAAAGSDRIAAALLNDVGPELEPGGLDHIRSYLGKSQSWPTWIHAARALCEAQRDRYPLWPLETWLVYAKRVCRLNAGGRIVLDYDMRIAEPLRLPAPEVVLWPAFRALAQVPTLLVRGALSDLLSEATAARMKAEKPDLEIAVVPDVGHAPTLEEPEAAAAVDALLDGVIRKLTDSDV
jgi:pimeloyl-ACP methyl ester carboxylesterase